jgi:predicted ester cyclase
MVDGTPSEVLVRRYLEGVLSRTTDGSAEAVCTEDFVVHFGADPPKDLGAWRAAASAYGSIFSDLEVEVVETFSAGDWVAARMRWSAIQHGEFLGVPGAGRRVESVGIGMYRMSGERLAEAWEIDDMVPVLRPSPMEPASRAGGDPMRPV